MDGTGERIRRVKLRAKQVEAKKNKRLITSLFSVCVVLATFLLGVIVDISRGGRYMVAGFYGSMLMYDDVGSHVLVGVISFSVAVVITVVCIRGKERGKKT